MKLFYRKFGEGPPLIILHGLFGSSDNWSVIAKAVAEKFTVYLPDLRNHGMSPHSNIHDYDSMRDDIAELVSDLGIKKFFLAGHSMGGKAAVSYTLKWPEMISGLLVADISPFVSGTKIHSYYNQYSFILNAILSINISSVSRREDADLLLSEKITSEKLRQYILKNLKRKEDRSFSWKINAKDLLNNLDKIMEGVNLKHNTIREITGFPVIFIRGEKSDYLPDKDFNDITKVFPVAEFRTIKNAGHWIQSDNPEEVAKNMLDLLL